MSPRKSKQQQPQSLQQYSRYGYGEYAPANYGKASRKGQGLSRGKSIAIGIVLVLITVGIIGGTVAYLFMQQIQTNLRGSYSEEQALNIKEQLQPVTNVDEPFYIMLIGSDERANDEEMGARSDTNILVRIDPVNWVVTMISIPRDTMITYNGSTVKFNASYMYGDGAAGVIQAASELCGVKISHYAEVNFDGVVALVDAIGGVEVDVPQALNDPQAGWVTIDEPGLQTLSGAQALVFARSRHYYLDGDFSRAANQRALIKAIAEKVLSLPIGEMPGVIQQMSQCISTDMTVSDIYSLAMQYRNSGKEMTMYSSMVPSTTQNVDGVSYVVADQQGLQDMMALVDAGEDPSTVELSSGATIDGNFEYYAYTEGLDE